MKFDEIVVRFNIVDYKLYIHVKIFFFYNLYIKSLHLNA